MARATEVPVTTSVLRWAIDESGYTRDELSAKLKISSAVLREWEKGDERPSLTEFRRLADSLRRQMAVFFLTEPPANGIPSVNLRFPPGTPRVSLNVLERKYLRDATRMQRTLGWLNEQLEIGRSSLPKREIRRSPEVSAAETRDLLRISVADQLAWQSSSEAFKRWREAVESLGIYVFVFSLGENSSRGFSVWNDFAPVVAVNSAWNVSARIFTLFHEVAHLVTRTDSACVGHVSISDASQDAPLERWCERFAAALLLPAKDVVGTLEADVRWDRKAIRDLDLAATIARRFKVSLRASVIRLIELKLAERSLYNLIPSAADARSRGGGGQGRARIEVKEDQLGLRSKKTFVRAISEDLITRADALTYLDIPYDDLAAAESGR